MRVVVGRGREQLSDGSSEEDPIFEYEGEEDVESPEDGSLENRSGLKWKFRNETWENPNFTYNPPPRPYSRCPRGPKFIYFTLPTFMTLFGLFWTISIIEDIVRETNRYATTPDANGKT